MKRLKSKAGFTLMELLVTIVVLLMLTAGITVSMDAGSKIYRESVFEADSALLAETLNNSLSDVLRNSTGLEENDGTFKDDSGNILTKEQVPFTFDNSSYGVHSAYIQTASSGRKVLMIKSRAGAEPRELVNLGAYPNLSIENYKIEYVHQDTTKDGGQKYGGYIKISYDIKSTQYDSLTRKVETVIRLLNNPLTSS